MSWVLSPYLIMCDGRIRKGPAVCCLINCARPGSCLARGRSVLASLNQNIEWTELLRPSAASRGNKLRGQLKRR